MNNQYDHLIRQHAVRPDFPPHYLKGMIHAESSFRPDARGPQNEIGLMQFLPSTAKEVGVTPEALLNPDAAIRAGAKYIGIILDRYVNKHITAPVHPKLRVMLAQFGYNAGPYFAQALAKKYGGNASMMASPSSFGAMVESLRGDAQAARLQKITGEKDFLTARRGVVEKYQKYADQYAGDFGGSPGASGGSEGPGLGVTLAVGTVLLAGAGVLLFRKG